ncbi:sigma factor-like helix-turn-helix DNA-binding protein [Kribbella sp. NPDC023855]|uniref:sigma factor-like helix-turn-helix DNA-binding protein n=1 Tax=Kribbella sp. NPDC023855 TaxID=3154698 RepID=UPI0033DE4019
MGRDDELAGRARVVEGALFDAVEGLPAEERMAFVLDAMFGVPADEIAAIIGCSPAAARELVLRARWRVRAGQAGLGALEK